MMTMNFIERSKLKKYEWDNETKKWQRPNISTATLKELSERNSVVGFTRVGLLFLLLILFLVMTVFVVELNLYLALLPLFGYYFFYGFLVALAHELQHKTVFSKKWDDFNEGLFWIVQALIWNGPVYARISHRLHHRYTMVRGYDPETVWPEVFTSKWVKGVMFGFIGRVLFIGAFYELLRDIKKLSARALGEKDHMMDVFCNDKECKSIQRESLLIILFHVVIVVVAIVTRSWLLILCVSIAWQVGSAFEGLWHSTEHIGKIYNVNDQVLCTRSVKVGRFLKLIYFGLDDHIEHHLYPAIPSYQLPQLHKLLASEQDKKLGVIECWKEIFMIAAEKNNNPNNEYVPEVIRKTI